MEVALMGGGSNPFSSTTRRGDSTGFSLNNFEVKADDFGGISVPIESYTRQVLNRTLETPGVSQFFLYFAGPIYQMSIGSAKGDENDLLLFTMSAALNLTAIGPEVSAVKAGVAPHLRAGQMVEGSFLEGLGTTGKVVFTPTAEHIESAAFKVIVGEAKYTPTGKAVSTIFDGSTASSLIELKAGSSTLTSTYQLRLQTYAALAYYEKNLIIYTSRPVAGEFGEWLSRWGVTVKPTP